MVEKRIKRPRDPVQLAKLIGDIATGQTEDKLPDDGKNPAAVELGKLGGKKGGKARMAKLTPDARKKLSETAAAARWEKFRKQQKNEVAHEPTKKQKHVIEVDRE